MAKNDLYPSFIEYIRKESEKKGPADMTAVACAGCATGFVGLAALGFFLSNFMAFWLAYALSFGIGFPLVMSAIEWVEKKLKAPRNANQQRKADAREAVKLYKSAIDRRRIKKELDPAAGQVLEACTFHYMRAKVALDSSIWKSSEPGSHRHALRTQILDALDAAMEEALILGKDCLGKPSKDNWKDKLENSLDIDIVDMVMSMTGVNLGDGFRDVHRSPHTRIVFHPMREIAEKLKMIASEVEQLTKEFAGQTSSLSGESAPAASLDIILAELRQVRQAEDELNQQHLQH